MKFFFFLLRVQELGNEQIMDELEGEEVSTSLQLHIKQNKLHIDRLRVFFMLFYFPL
jgi:hypothetical protein